MSHARRFLFICGCPRSGTTALWNLVTASPQIVLGIERYSSRLNSRWNGLSPALFEYDRFFTMHAGDTFYDDLDAFHPYYQVARARWHGATFIGDKVPGLYRTFRRLGRMFPGVKVLCMFRDVVDVAASYKRRAEDTTDTTWGRTQGVDAAISDWGHAIAAFAAARPRVDVLPVAFEDLFVEGRGLERIGEFLGLSDLAPMRETHLGLLFAHGKSRRTDGPASPMRSVQPFARARRSPSTSGSRGGRAGAASLGADFKKLARNLKVRASR